MPLNPSSDNLSRFSHNSSRFNSRTADSSISSSEVRTNTASSIDRIRHTAGNGMSQTAGDGLQHSAGEGKYESGMERLRRTGTEAIAARAASAAQSGTGLHGDNGSHDGRGRKKRSAGRIILMAAAGIFAFSLVANVTMSLMGIYINVSPSLPYGFYKVEYRDGIDYGLFGFSGVEDADLGNLIDPKGVSREQELRFARRTIYAGSVSGPAPSPGTEDAFGTAAGVLTREVSSEEPVTDSGLPAVPSTVKARTLEVKRGELVLACLETRMARFGYERGYLTAGKCPGGIAPVGKYVAAVTGDKIDYNCQGVLVNDRLISNTASVKRDGAGRPMPLYAEPGSYFTLEEDEVMLLNEKVFSYDSRYFGPVRSYFIIARLRPLLTF